MTHSGAIDPKEILKARALLLAREPHSKAEPGDAMEVVVFRLADEQYAIESVRVREVYPIKELTPIPCTPPFVLGIINVRGQILTVIDLRRFFELPIKGLTDLNKVIILEHEGSELGVLADAILGVRLLCRQEIQPSPSTLTGIRGKYLVGVTDEQLIVLDAARIMEDPAIVVHEEVAGD